MPSAPPINNAKPARTTIICLLEAIPSPRLDEVFCLSTGVSPFLEIKEWNHRSTQIDTDIR
jgi:hypothetical protein